MKRQYAQRLPGGRLIPVTRQRVASDLKLSRKMGAAFHIVTINRWWRQYRTDFSEFVPAEMIARQRPFPKEMYCDAVG